MADYYEQSVVEPFIPKKFLDEKDIQILEAYGFKHEETGRDDLYLFADEGIAPVPYREVEGISENDEYGWVGVLQRAIRRSKGALPYIKVASAFTANKMVPDGYGGMGWFITARNVKTQTVSGWLSDQAKAFKARSKRGAKGRRRKTRLSMFP